MNFVYLITVLNKQIDRMSYFRHILSIILSVQSFTIGLKIIKALF
jgi:hypothetical protein